MDATEQSPARSPIGRFLTATPAPRESLILGIALALLASLPLLVAAVPQMVDYASHLARYHVMLDGGRSPFLNLYYAFEWRWSGNLGADILIRPFAWLFGLETGARIMATLIPALTGLGIVTVEWTLRKRIGAGSMLALALIWSPALVLGFLNFGLALAAALFAFALWVKLEGRRWRSALFVPISLAVWLCHLSGWGVLGVLVFAYEFHRKPGFPGFWAAILKSWPLLPPLVPVLLGGGAGGLLDYGKNALAYKMGIFMQALRDQQPDLDMLSALLLVVLFVWALARRKVDGRLGIAAVLLLLLAAVLPRHLGGGDYADYRLIAVGLMVACLAIDKPGPRLLLWLAPALFLVRLGVTTEAWDRTSHQSERMLTIVDRLPAGARVAAAVLIERTDWAIDPFQHLPSYATVRRDALVNTHFAVPGLHMLRLRDGPPDFIDPSHRVFHSPGEPIDLADFAPASHADYLWYIGAEEPTALPPGATVIARAPGTILARLANPPRGS